MDEDIVIFRQFPDGDVIALFPCLAAECLNPWPCQSYMHIGRHGAADPRIVEDTRPAGPHAYARLKGELERIGYRLAVRHRFPSNAYACRRASLHPLAAGTPHDHSGPRRLTMPVELYRTIQQPIARQP